MKALIFKDAQMCSRIVPLICGAYCNVPCWSTIKGLVTDEPLRLVTSLKVDGYEQLAVPVHPALLESSFPFPENAFIEVTFGELLERMG